MWFSVRAMAQPASTLKDPGGRPLKFNSVEELEEQIALWLKARKDENKPLTMSSLAVYLECDTRTLRNYQKNQEFFPTISKVRQLCEAYAEEQLYRETGQVAGVIFAMKNNYGYADKTDLNAQIQGNMTVQTVSYSGAGGVGKGGSNAYDGTPSADGTPDDDDQPVDTKPAQAAPTGDDDATDGFPD
jgi:hypothetical protein